MIEILMFALVVIIGVTGQLLGWWRNAIAPAQSLEQQVLSCLPQTQCQQCGFNGCAPYAKAIVAGDVDYNRCPPGGDTTLKALAAVLHRPAQPLATDLAPAPTTPLLALIDEAHCIGCTKCIQVCPTDAIIGTRKRMHTVIAEDCTGCGLCLPPCPTDCIEMVAS